MNEEKGNVPPSRSPSPPGRLGALALTILLSGLLIGCSESRSSSGTEEPPPSADRTFQTVSWDTLFQVGGSPDDTLLFQPTALAADSHRVAVADRYGGRIHVFDRTGRLEWSWGRKGEGPDEISWPRALTFDRTGHLWLLDVDNHRVVVLDSGGEVRARISLDQVGVRSERLVPLDDGHFLLLALDSESPLVQLDLDGTVTRRFPFGWRGYADLDPLAAQVVTDLEPYSGRWIAALVLGNGFFLFHGTEWSGVRGWSPEVIPSPRVVRHEDRSGGRTNRISRVEAPSISALSVSLSPDRLFLHVHGRTEHRGRILDVHDARDGSYLHTVLLPRAASRVARGGEVVYALFETPFPALAAWRPQTGHVPEPPKGSRP